jgi:hypothetical protein
MCPCYRDPFAPVADVGVDVCCCRLSTLVMVAVWCAIGGLLTVGGLFFFFSFIFEFAKHKFLMSEEALALGIVLFFIGFYVLSRVLRSARDAGLHNDLSLAWAPIYCPGFGCHMCCTSKHERGQFCQRRCRRKNVGKNLNEYCSWCCCIDTDRKKIEVKFNRVFQNELEWKEEVEKELAVREEIELQQKIRDGGDELAGEGKRNRLLSEVEEEEDEDEEEEEEEVEEDEDVIINVNLGSGRRRSHRGSYPVSRGGGERKTSMSARRNAAKKRHLKRKSKEKKRKRRALRVEEMVDGVDIGSSSSTVVDETGTRKKKKKSKKKKKREKAKKEKRGLDEEIEASLLHPKSP